MSKSLPIRICGNTDTLNRHLKQYIEQRTTAETAEQAKKEASMAIMQLQSDAGTFQTDKFQFTVVAEVVADSVTLSDIRKECPEIAELLASKGLIKQRVTKAHITAVKEL